MIKKVVFLLSLVVLFSGPGYCRRHYLFKWDEGEGTNMPGWTYTDDVAYGHPGWTLNRDGPFGGGKTYMWGYGPRCFEKGGNSTDSIAIIDTENRAPSTFSGGSLKIVDIAEEQHVPGWWVWYDGEPLSAKGITDEFIDRWSFYLKVEGIETLPKDGLYNNFPEGNFHIGTYLCWNDGGPVYGQGDGCPYEGPGNQHYYHYLSVEPDAWLHVLLDQHPQHRRDSYVAGNDPSFLLYGKHYFNQLHQWYMLIKQGSESSNCFYVDEMYFYSTKDSEEEAEPNQNDSSITSVWVGYWPDKDKWQIFWNDQSFETEEGENRNDTTWSTFQIKWSVEPITNENWPEANKIEAEFYSGPLYTGATDTSMVRNITSWRTICWTQFELPDEVEQHHNHIYFAIKDVSVEGQHAGTRWPYNRGDGHDAPSPYIHTIDYYLRPDSNYADEDVNQDGQINISDVQLVVNVILGNATNSRADVNGDGSVTISDVQEVVNEIVD